MPWITEQQATEFIASNSEWDAFGNKAELIQMATNRLEQLKYKRDNIYRSEPLFTDGTLTNDTSKVIPYRLLSACALLAFEYGKHSPNLIGDKEYLENENEYDAMQDLPIAVQSAVEPFLSAYVEPLLKDDNGKTLHRKATSLHYDGDPVEAIPAGKIPTGDELLREFTKSFFE